MDLGRLSAEQQRKKKDISAQITLRDLLFLGSTCIWRITGFIRSPCPQGSAVGLVCTLERALRGVQAGWCAPAGDNHPTAPIFMTSGSPIAGWAGWEGWLGSAGLEGCPPSLGHLWVSLRKLFQLACATPSGMFWSHFQALPCKQQFQELVLILSEANIARNLRP